MTICCYFCLTWFSEDYSWIGVSFLTSNSDWPCVYTAYGTTGQFWNYKFQISNFKFQISNFKFQSSKFQISKFNSNSQGGNTDNIFILRQTLLTETDRQKWFLYCHFIPLPRRAVVYLVILPWFMICKHIAGFPTKIELFQTRFSFGKKYFMKILNRCMASWLLHLQEYIMKIDYIYIYN